MPPPVQPPPLTKVAATLATELCEPIKLDPHVRALVQPGDTPSQFLDELIGQGELSAALTVLAFALPKREAVWWGCLCARAAVNGPLPAKQADALRAVIEWVVDPSDQRRRACEKLSEEATLDVPAGCLAYAVFCSSGSLLAPSLPVVEPPKTLAHEIVGAAVRLAAALGDADAIEDRKRQFIGLGFDVARGTLARPEPRK